MSIIDTIVQKLTGEEGAASAANPALLGHLTDLVNNPETGGLQGLIQKFHSNGLGDLVNSWVGSGANQSISGDQVASVIGQDRLGAIASKFGIQPDQISGLVAQHLPDIISKLSSSAGAATHA
jgi:uncharacterized protein YidB (DUF937 family)